MSRRKQRPCIGPCEYDPPFQAVRPLRQLQLVRCTMVHIAWCNCSIDDRTFNKVRVLSHGRLVHGRGHPGARG